ACRRFTVFGDLLWGRLPNVDQCQSFEMMSADLRRRVRSGCGPNLRCWLPRCCRGGFDCTDGFNRLHAAPPFPREASQSNDPGSDSEAAGPDAVWASVRPATVRSAELHESVFLCAGGDQSFLACSHDSSP